MLGEAIRIGIGGPVGSGKTRLIERLLPLMAADGLRVAVITNDLVTREDAERLQRSALIAPELVVGVETGACPHTAIREDPSANIDAAQRLEREHGPLDAILIESGLGFLGLSDASVVSWGQLLFVAQDYLDQAWWMSVFPGAAICSAVIGLNMLADGLNEVVNPRAVRRAAGGLPG